MEIFDLIIVEQAIIEIENTFNVYNERVEGLGAEFNEEVWEVLDTIQQISLLFSVKFEQVREAVLLRFPFVITYEIVDKKVVV